ncbi:hypothetical protein FQN60_013430, partial [Etheostoma spectabile]
MDCCYVTIHSPSDSTSVQRAGFQKSSLSLTPIDHTVQCCVDFYFTSFNTADISSTLCALSSGTHPVLFASHTLDTGYQSQSQALHELTMHLRGRELWGWVVDVQMEGVLEYKDVLDKNEV